MSVQEDFYKIGAVAKRTGIAPERLRAWERRYGLEPAARAGHTRFYSTEQVERLGSIKALLDQGHSISQVIQLDDAELQRRLRPLPKLSPGFSSGRRALRVGLIGTQLMQAYRESADSALDVLAEWPTLGEAAAQRDVVPELDCVGVFMPTLDPQRFEMIEDACEGSAIVVAYKYATAADLAHFQASACSLLRWPATWRNLEDAIIAKCPAEPIGDEARLYNDEELMHIRSVADRTDRPCPRHLADLIGEINDFHAHAVRSDGDDDHCAIVADLNTARTYLEHALQELVEKHGLIAVD